MTYDVQNTRGSTVLSLGDNTIDSTYSIFLIGKNTPNYGDALNENMIRLLEHNAAGSAPSNPIEGQVWYDTTNFDLKVWRINGSSGNGWVSVARSASVSEPSSLTSINGDLWYDTSTHQLKVYNNDSTTWDIVGPDYSSAQQLSGQKIMTLTDTLAVNHYAIVWYINNIPFAIVSKDTAYTLSTSLSGFTSAPYNVISPGINFSGSFAVSLTGGSGTGLTANNSIYLGGYTSSQYMRSDVDTSAAGIVSFTNTTDSSVYTNGSAKFSGGIGVAKSVYIHGVLNVSNGATSTSTTTGTVTVTGGIGISGNINSGGIISAASIQNTPVGSTTRASGAFTTLVATGAVAANANTTSTSTTTGTVVITGGLGVSGNINAGGRATVSGGIQNTPIGNATTNTGAFTSLSASGNTRVTSANAASSTSTGALVVTGGVGIGGELWVAGDANFGNVFAGNLSVGSLTASNVEVSNVGASANYYVTFVDTASGSTTLSADGSTNGLKYNPGTDTLYANLISGTTTMAQYADVAERYDADSHYDVGTVVIFGGTKEITITEDYADIRVAGVVSENPALLMNSHSTGLPVALRGKVQVNVVGAVTKGDLLVTSSTAGYAQSGNYQNPSAVFAKALETNDNAEMKKIYAVIV